MVSEFFYPHWTGIAKTFLRFSRHLVDEQHQVTVLTSRYSKDLSVDEALFGFRVKRSRCLFHISRTYYSVHMLFDFVHLAREHDVVVINSPFSNILFITLLSKLFGKKTFIYHQGDLTLPKMYDAKFSNKILEKVFDCFTKTSMFLSDNVFTYTEDYAKNSRVMKSYLGKFKPFIPKVKIDAAVPSPDFLKTMMGLKSEGMVVGFAGRFVEEKGFDVLFKAIPLVLRKLPEVHFAFAGEVQITYENFYKHNESLLLQNKENIHLLGLLGENELYEFYKALSLFVVSSRSDCFPVTQIEAAYVGVPLVCTDIPGARMLIKETGFGLLAESENPQSLAECIIKVLQNREQFLKKKDNVKIFFGAYEELRFN